jgi:hypothetical protein
LKDASGFSHPTGSRAPELRAPRLKPLNGEPVVHFSPPETGALFDAP